MRTRSRRTPGRRPGQPPTPAAASSTAIRLRLAGFDGGRALRLPDPDGQAATRLGAAGLPTTLFIGADGTLWERHVGALKATEPRANIHRHLRSASPDRTPEHFHKPSRSRPRS